MHSESVQVKTLQNRVAALTQQVREGTSAARERGRVGPHPADRRLRASVAGPGARPAPLLLRARFSGGGESGRPAQAALPDPLRQAGVAGRGDRAGAHHEHI